MDGRIRLISYYVVSSSFMDGRDKKLSAIGHDMKRNGRDFLCKGMAVTPTFIHFLKTHCFVLCRWIPEK